MTAKFDEKYIVRVTATDPTGVGLTMGFLLDAKAYDALKEKHAFDVKEGHFKYMTDTEYYRIKALIDDYLTTTDK